MTDAERLRDYALQIAAGEIGVREAGRNRGIRVEMFQAAAGAHPGDPWCASFVVWAYKEACHGLSLEMPLPVTPGALALWRRGDPIHHWHQPSPGAVFVLDHGGGMGHCGFVESITPLHIVTVEGNTNDSGGREGVGVYRRIRRLDGGLDGLVGFVDTARTGP